MQRKFYLMAGLFAALGLVLATEAGQPLGKKATEIESKAEQSTSPATVNFAKDLDLSFPSLVTLGGRIEDARQQADPVALALLARELKVAEDVSGKTTSVKSADLAKEAAEVAKLRFNPQEIKAVAMTIGDKEAKKSLMDVAEKANEYQIAQAKARESGEKTRGITGTLHVDSRVRGSTLTVYVNGYRVGVVGPYGDSYFYIGHQPYDNTYLYARSGCGCYTWRRTVSGPQGSYHWTLNP